MKETICKLEFANTRRHYEQRNIVKATESSVLEDPGMCFGRLIHSDTLTMTGTTVYTPTDLLPCG
jgi:hypothetical protein